MFGGFPFISIAMVLHVDFFRGFFQSLENQWLEPSVSTAGRMGPQHKRSEKVKKAQQPPPRLSLRHPATPRPLSLCRVSPDAGSGTERRRALRGGRVLRKAPENPRL